MFSQQKGITNSEREKVSRYKSLNHFLQNDSFSLPRIQISTTHFLWAILPIKLKDTLSLYQKPSTQILEPIKHDTFVCNNISLSQDK